MKVISLNYDVAKYALPYVPTSINHNSDFPAWMFWVERDVLDDPDTVESNFHARLNQSTRESGEWMNHVLSHPGGRFTRCEDCVPPRSNTDDYEDPSFSRASVEVQDDGRVIVSREQESERNSSDALVSLDISGMQMLLAHELLIPLDNWRIDVSVQCQVKSELISISDQFMGLGRVSNLMIMTPGDKIELTFRCRPPAWYQRLHFRLRNIELVEKRIVSYTSEGMVFSEPKYTPALAEVIEQNGRAIEREAAIAEEQLSRNN